MASVDGDLQWAWLGGGTSRAGTHHAGSGEVGSNEPGFSEAGSDEASVIRCRPSSSLALEVMRTPAR